MSKPRPLLVLGLMSGTSADAIDIALTKISGAPPNLKSELLNHTTIPYTPQLQKEILRVAEQNPITAGDLSQLNFRLGHAYAEATAQACKKFRVSLTKVDLLGSHGQTIFHQGPPVPYLGRPIASTLQIGEPAIIAAKTGITTIADFRPADMAVGGQGAPLVPYADYLLYRHEKLGRVSLNLGGIANITVLPAACKPSDVFAFDTGPANMLIDALIQHFTHNKQRYDKNAALAAQGRSIPNLVDELMKDPYLKKSPPKSTGREYYGQAYVQKFLTMARRHNAKPNDAIRAVTIFTAISIVDALNRFVLPQHKIHQLIVSGGGAKNPLILAQLTAALSQSNIKPDIAIAPASVGADFQSVPATQSNKTHADNSSPGRRSPASIQVGTQQATPQAGTMPTSSTIEVFPSSHLNVPTDAKEAYAFALMAYETFHHRPSNLPSATGAHKPAILGKISYAPPR
jgi:anhydro-N-acetylmuramic acid kinase